MLSKILVFFHKSLKQKQGFSLVEVMIAAGMMGLVSLGVAQLMSNMSKNMRWTETKTEELQLINHFNQELRDNIVCTHTLVGSCSDKAYSTATACTDASQVWTPNVVSLNGDITNVKSRTLANLFVKGTTYGTGAGKIKLKSMTFIADPGNAPVANQQGTAIIRLELERQDPTHVGTAQTVKSDVRLTVLWNSPANTISSCYADREDTILTAKKEACENLGGDYITAGGPGGGDWCKLETGPDTANPGTWGNPKSNAVEKAYVDDLFRRSCLGPGREYLAGPPPTCNVTASLLQPAECPVGSYATRVSFSDNEADATKYDASDAETMTIQCRQYCAAGQIFLGVDANYVPKCLNCGDKEIPMFKNNAWVCISAASSLCSNNDDGTNIEIRAFDGWKTIVAFGFSFLTASCRTIMTFPKAACANGSVMTGFTMGATGTLAPQCCVKGDGCPAANTVCQNGYEAKSDTCGMLCPGTKQASSTLIGQPLVYGCQTDSPQDENQVTTGFYSRQCGGNPAQEVPSTGRACRIGGLAANHTYKQCHDYGGGTGKVRFFSAAVADNTVEQASGQEKDSFCMIPQVNNDQTYGRGSNSIVEACRAAENCPNVKTLDDNAVNNARGCPNGWTEALSFEGKLFYKVAQEPCSCMEFSDENDNACTPAQLTCTSSSISAGTFYAAPGGSKANWPGAKKDPANNFYDKWTHSSGGVCRLGNTVFCDGSDLVWGGYDCNDPNPVAASFKCYARILGISCK